MIDWQAFTPYSALIGGVLIGLGALLLFIFNGRVAGISGIAAQLLITPTLWRVLFVSGLIVSPWVYGLWGDVDLPQTNVAAWQLVLAGLLVGFGSRLGGGCTSGHGVCGIARISKRSIVATVIFITMGMLTVWLMRHVLGG